MSNRNHPIHIIGSGISGISTGIIFLMYGYPVTIYTNRNITRSTLEPSFSSLYPAASIIPHTVNHPNLDEIFLISQEFFKNLCENDFEGISKHRHFELFGFHQESFDYVQWMANSRTITPDYDGFLPEHPTIETKSGWEFDCYFTDWPLYLPSLLDLYHRLGGEIIHKEIDSIDRDEIDSEIVINCSGISGPELLGEISNSIIYKGHLLNILGDYSLIDKRGNLISYNFTPGTSYRSDNGVYMDLYAYPRTDGLVLGGSRIKGTLDGEGNWIPSDSISNQVIIDSMEVPSKILELNAEILEQSFNMNILQNSNIRSKIGYRFMGNNEEELRIDIKDNGSQTVINNFGHGGAGVTLSWGSAVKVFELFHSIITEENPSVEQILNQVETKLVEH